MVVPSVCVSLFTAARAACRRCLARDQGLKASNFFLLGGHPFGQVFGLVAFQAQQWPCLTSYTFPGYKITGSELPGRRSTRPPSGAFTATMLPGRSPACSRK